REKTFQRASEEEQRDHVEQQVLEIRVHQAVAQQPPVLVFFLDRGRPQQQPLHQLVILERHPRNKASNGEDRDGQQHVGSFPSRASCFTNESLQRRCNFSSHLVLGCAD